MLESNLFDKFVDKIKSGKSRIIYPGTLDLPLPLIEADRVVVLSSGTIFADHKICESRSGLNIVAQVKMKIPGQQWSILKASSTQIQDLRSIASQAAQVTENFDMPKFISRVTEFGRDIGASDIHIIKRNDTTKIEMRVDGDLEIIEEFSCDGNRGMLLIQSIYGAHIGQGESNFDPSKQQDGNIDRTKLPPDIGGIRLSCTPIENGHLMVMRLQYKDGNRTLSTYQSLGFHDDHIVAMDYMKRHPDSLNLVTGPTNTGKSLTLKLTFEALHQFYSGRKRQLTVEDPAEHEMIIPQISLRSNTDDEEARLKQFNAVLSGVLRLDPDDILIGEVRDLLSAGFALKAAQTGHRVWTTLHCKDAVQVLPRLELLGVPRGFLADPSLITGIINQRLIAKLCNHCRIELEKASNEKLIGSTALNYFARMDLPIENMFVKGYGCSHCRGKGTKGKTVVAEALVPDEEYMRLFLEGKSSDMRRHAFSVTDGQGWMSKVKHARYLVSSGIVDPFEADLMVGSLEDEINTSHKIITLDSLRSTAMDSFFLAHAGVKQRQVAELV